MFISFIYDAFFVEQTIKNKTTEYTEGTENDGIE